MRESSQDPKQVIVPSSKRGDGAVPAPFRVNVVPERESVRVCPVGDVDIATAHAVRGHLEALVAEGFDRVVLDLRDTTFLDSTGLSLALDTQAAAERDGFVFSIIPGPPCVRRAFDVAGLGSHLSFVDPHRRTALRHE